MAHIYLMENGAKLGFSQGQLVVKPGGDKLERRFPFCNVESVNVLGGSQITTQLVRECLSANVPIAYFTEDGHYCGMTSCLDHVDPHRQRQQALLTCNDEFCLNWAKTVVEAKINNSLQFLASVGDLYVFSEDELGGLRHSEHYVRQASTVDEVLGFEGNAAKCYFQCYAKLLHGTEFSFGGRKTRPPKDPVNAMLSYGYSFLHRSIIGAIERHGLHPYFGFMHKMKRGHATLASDLIEDYRALLVDKIVLGLAGSGEVSPADFTVAATGAVYLPRPVMEKLTNLLSSALADKARYCQAYGDGYQYGFQAALDKKLCTVIAAIDSADASLYQPFVWSAEQ
ncbi:CRISPR-associated endonuclease Cas1 [Paratractidigestivibacter sp.]|uniref:CRISPR-associated endonuclease Cas1 n=1 Tax=Paratractidigestivibacter sp. TaxID=2847316 RepID=UPI002AC92F06|nr:CRISPR-associated endonuclease Cas1 [Paratractidigestivibacter sp.]